MSAAAGPPPGWHPDPYRQAKLRYWDGALWTGHVSGGPAGVAPAALPGLAGPALPTTAPFAPAQAAPGPSFDRGFAGGRLRHGRTLAIFVGLFAVLVIGGALAITLGGRDAEVPRDCLPGRMCSEPPVGEPLVNGAVYRSSALAFELEYNTDLWKVTDEGADFVELTPTDAPGLAQVRVSGVPAGDATAEAFFDDRFDIIASNFVGLTEDTDTVDIVHGPAVGYVDAIGGAYTGAIDTPQGLLDASAVVMTAGDEDVTLSADVITTAQRAQTAEDVDVKGILYNRIDSLINAVRFPSEAGAS